MKNINPESIFRPSTVFNQDKQAFWLQGRDKRLEEVYGRIAPGIPLVNVRHRELFLEKCEEYYSEIIAVAQKVKEIERWDAYEIERMFGKGLNPTSLKTALNNIEFFVENLKIEGDTVRVVEFGPGSGWSTLMLRNALTRKFPDKQIELFSVDKSPHSIVATQNSLDYYQIPWQTNLESIKVTNISEKSSFVNLILADFIEFSKEQPENYFDGYFSSHGTAYLSENEYETLLETLKSSGKSGAIFVADSLDPLYTVKLDTLHLILCSIFPNRVPRLEEYYYGKSMKSNSKYFPGQEVKKIVRVNNEESKLFYEWNNYLLSKLKILYIIQMLSSIRTTTEVIEEYREDVYPSYLVKELLDRKSLKGWQALEGLPECPLYITNCGLILRK